MQSIRSLIWIQIVAVATKTASMEKCPNYKNYVIKIRFDKKVQPHRLHLFNACLLMLFCIYHADM